MQTQKSKLKRLTALMMAALLVFGSTLQAFALSGSVTDRKQATVTSGSTNWSFTLRDSAGKNYRGTCIEPSNGIIPEVGGSVTMTEASRTSMTAKIVYLGTRNGIDDVQMYVISRAAGRARGDIPYNNYVYDDLVNDLYDRAQAMTGSVPSSFIVYVANPSNGGQTMAAWRNVEPATLQVNKTSSTSTSLSLAGAKYGVYTTKAAANDNDWDYRVGTLETVSGGKSNKLEVYPDTYYIKETLAPDGFALDPKVYTVTVSEGEAVVINSVEELSTSKLKLQKSAAESTSLTLAGAKYGVYTTRAAAEDNDWDYRVGTLETESDGSTNTLTLLPKTYYIKETLAPDGFEKDPEIHVVTLKAGETTTIKSVEQLEKGHLKLKKSAAESTSLSFAGAKYGVYTTKAAAEDNDWDYRVGTLETESDGSTNTLTLLPRTYYIKETLAPEGFEKDPEVYVVTLKGDETITVKSEEELTKGWAKVKKVPSENTHLVEACPQQYSLAGAEYGIYTSSSLSASTKVATLTTKSDGSSNSVELPIGTYYAKETKRPKGYKIDEKVHKIVVTRNATTTFTSEEKPLFDPINILLQKKDGGGNGEAPSLAGGEFTVKYYDTITSNVSGLTAKRTWKFKTNAAGRVLLLDSYKIGGDNLYKDDDGAPVGLIGTYTIQETKAPKGYVKDDTIYYAHVKEAGTSEPVTVYNEPEVTNERKEFSLKLAKKDSETGTTAQGDGTLAGAVFGLYRDDKLVKRYTTASDGTFTTEYHTLGDGSHTWSVKEITPPEGYVKNTATYTLKGLVEEDITVQYTTVNQTVNNDVIKGSIAITKVYGAKNETGHLQPEEGISFRVYLKSAGSYEDALDTEKDLITTDKYGYAQTKDLPYGVYTVHQVNTTDGHDMVDDFDIFIREDGAVYRFTLNNAETRADIRVQKVDSETGNIIPAANTAFKIWDVAAGDWISFEMKYPNPYILDTFLTDASGTFQLPDTLDYGQYQLVEQQAPEGYVLSKEPVDFQVDGSAKLITVTAENVPQKGTIQITKTGEVLQSVTENEDGTYTPVFGEGYLKDAVFEITAAEDIYTPDGTKRYQKDEVVDTVTTGEDGRAVTKELYLGSYVITETKAPENHIVSGESYLAELTYAGQEVEITSTELTVDNERQKAKVSFVKALETDGLYGYGGDVSKDIRFGIFAAEDITAEDGSILPAGGMICDAGVTEEDETGLYTGTFDTDLPHGNFFVQETKTAQGYLLDDTKYEVIFDYAGQDTALVEITVNDGKVIENHMMRGDIIGHKVTTDGTSLPGALMGLFTEDETEFTEDTALLSTLTGSDGMFSFEDVAYGKYIVREIRQPEGYVLSDKSYEVVIDQDGDEVRLQVVNEHTKVEILKNDVKRKTLPPGAALQPINSEEDKIATWKLTKPEHKKEELPVTGDSRQPVVWMITAFLGIGTLITGLRRKPGDKK